VIATGSEPVLPPIEGLAELDSVWTNRQATGVKELPVSLLILGGGPVGVEIAQALGRMGVEVTIVEGDSQLLPREARTVGEALAGALRAEGIELHLGSFASRASREGEEYALRFDEGTELRAEKMLVATGRRPRLEGLGLATVGIEPVDGAVSVDERLRAADGVWAIGDATGIMPFTHVGKYQARIAARDILAQPARADYRAVPRVVFTDPQVAAVGEQEGELTGTVELSGVARTSTYTREYAERPGFLTLVSDGRKQTGAYAVGPEAGEWLQQATLAIRGEVPLEVLMTRSSRSRPSRRHSSPPSLISIGLPGCGSRLPSARPLSRCSRRRAARACGCAPRALRGVGPGADPGSVRSRLCRLPA
jgi:pyruvate/2-oxoglutarate dehydrogenase complex dihydrolipoamide dehydrogenase (E3) component